MDWLRYDTLNLTEPIYAVSIVIVAILFAIKPTRKFLNHFVTVFHEVGHAVAALLTGGGVNSIKINSDGSGVTMSSQKIAPGHTLKRFIGLLSGYSFPITSGFLIILFTVFSLPIAALVTFAAICLISLLFIRNIFGAFIVLILCGASAALYFYTPNIFIVFLTTTALYMIVAGFHDLWTVSRHVKRSEGSSDFTLMKDELHIALTIGVIIEWLWTVASIMISFFAVQVILYLINNPVIPT
jgi:hypothetical protein